jgi:hypothetical protein
MFFRRLQDGTIYVLESTCVTQNLRKITTKNLTLKLNDVLIPPMERTRGVVKVNERMLFIWSRN